MATGIDFTALIKGEQLADNANWANIRRIQDQDTYAIAREAALAKQMEQRQGREASTYLSTILPNLQRYADQGLNPVDALINQRSAIQNDVQFQNMRPEVQTQILNGLGQTASLQMQALKNAGNMTDLQRLISTFGGVNPINPLGAAVKSGDPMAIFNAVNAQAPGAFTLSADGKFVVDKAGAQVPLNDWAAYTAAGLGTENSAAGGLGAFQAQGQQDRALAAAGVLKTEEQQRAAQAETYQAAMALQSGMPLERVRAIFPDADPSVFAAPVAATGAPVTTLNWNENGVQTNVPMPAATGTAAAMPGMAPSATAAAAVPGAAAAGPLGATSADLNPVEIPADVWGQFRAQSQTANSTRLDSSLSTIIRGINEGKARLQQLAAEQQAAQVELQSISPQQYYPGAQGPVANPAYNELVKRLQANEAERAAIGKNMDGFMGAIKDIQNRREVLALSPVSAAPATDFMMQLQKDLSQ